MIPNLLFLLLLASTSLTHAASLERVQLLMGTTARIQVWAVSKGVCDQAIHDAFDALHRVDREMSTYKPDSQLTLLNQKGGADWVEIGTGLTEVLGASIRFSRDSGGAFDPTVMPLMFLWGFRGGTPRLPEGAEIEAALRVVGIEHLELDTTKQRARFKTPGVSLDLGGIAKGYALDRALESALAAGAHSAIVDLGGNMISFGDQAAGDVAIQHPLDPDGILGKIGLRNASIATSGGYEKYVTIDGKRYGHVLDPRTGRPAEGAASVTVIARTGLEADALSTACFVLAPAQCFELVSRHPDAACVVAWTESDSLAIQSSPGLQLLDP